MSGIGEFDIAFQAAGGRVSPNEIDAYERINTGILSTSSTWVGTAAGGTASQSQPLVLINRNLDYPRNLVYSQVGTNAMGGTWTITGKDQFGYTVTESVGNGTVAAGTPAWTVAGTTIFEEVTAGTFVTAATAVGAGSPRIGVATGTAGTIQYKLGLLTKIASTADVKAITWVKENVATTLNGGTIGALVDATNHAFTGTANLGGTESFNVLLRSSFSNLGKPRLANL